MSRAEQAGDPSNLIGQFDWAEEEAYSCKRTHISTPGATGRTVGNEVLQYNTSCALATVQHIDTWPLWRTRWGC